MLSEWLWRQWTGWVKVRLHGPECEGVITDLIAQGQKVWGLSRRPGGGTSISSSADRGWRHYTEPPGSGRFECTSKSAAAWHCP
ncbi:MAG: hypothetical protein M1415_01850 [Firmicutes bacterium]|nr:hypothetical protein [Bacillota bacterium]